MTSLLSLPAAPKAGQRVFLPDLAGSCDALAISQLAGGKRLLTVVTASPLEAQRLAEEIGWFAPALRVHLLPDWETLPYDHFSPHQDLVSERLATLFAVTQGQCDVLIVAASTAATRLAPPSFLAAHTFFMKKGDKLDLDKLRAQMTLAGYQHVTQVVAPGEYSVRGGLVDLFPMGTQLPYRIELFDDEIETLRSFDPSAVLGGDVVSRYVDEIARRASGPALQKALALARARKWTEIESAVPAGATSSEARALTGMSRFARREFTTANPVSVDPAHAGRVDDISRAGVELRWRQGGATFSLGYEAEWRSVLAASSYDIDEVKEYRKNSVGLGVALSSRSAR